MTSNQTQFNEGDLVEAVKGETVVRGRLRIHPDHGDCLWVGDLSQIVDNLIYEGYTVTVITPPLPTEGTWLDQLGQAWQFDATNLEEFPILVGAEGRQEPAPFSAPFTRLEPVPVTVKKVIDRLDVLTRTTFQTLAEDFDQVRREFGVQS